MYSIKGFIDTFTRYLNKKQLYTCKQYTGNELAIKNIQKKKMTKNELMSEYDLMQTTLKSIGDGVVSTNCKNEVNILNPVAEKLTGWTQDEAKGKKINDVFEMYDKSGGTKINWSNTIQNVKGVLISKDKCEHLVSVNVSPIMDTADQSRGLVIIFRDITEEKMREEKILYLSYHDALTGLYNRRFFEEEMRRLDSSRQLPISIIIGDVNGLKLVNDVFGHEEGDKLLCHAAGIIKNACRAEDIIARWGGDEFVILLPDTSIVEIEKICNRITQHCNEYDHDVTPLKISISLGFDTKESKDLSLSNALKRAEDFMYKRKLGESKNLRNAMVESIKKTLYKKSHETEEHVERLKILCKKIGTNLNLDNQKLNDLDLLAVIHDLGKIIVASSVLNKPVRLTTDEWREMRRHPEIGYRIAQASPELFHIAEYILSHHERWDGKGYPRGLKGEEIQLISRIFLVADAFEAMTNGRPYRSSVSEDEAMKIIRQNSGTQFDPIVVNALEEIVGGSGAIVYA